MLVQLAAGRSGRGYVRPFNPARDLNDLADLVETAFGQELARTESHIARDMRQLSVCGPLLWAINSVASVFSGFVWIEDGHLVGNVTIFPTKAQTRTWTIANVAVLPEYRNRGIAGQLVDTAIERARRVKARRILLQVRVDNASARALYEHRGFVPFDTVHELLYPREQWPLVLGTRAAKVRRVRAGDGHQLYRLVKASTPPTVLRRCPIRAQDYYRGIWWKLGQLVSLGVGGPGYLELVGEENGELVAYLQGTARVFHGTYELAMYVHPEQRGEWELALVEAAMVALQHAPYRGAKATISSNHTEAIQALAKVGFKPTRLLLQMSLEL